MRRAGALVALLAVAGAWGWAVQTHDAAVLAGPAGNANLGWQADAESKSGIRSVGDQLRAQLRRERAELRAARRDAARWRAAVQASPSVDEAISLAATAFGQSESYMRTIMFRESRFDPGAQNPTSTACGLAQFLDTTWAATPFGRFACTSPHANALAMAWALRNWGSSPWALTRP